MSVDGSTDLTHVFEKRSKEYSKLNGTDYVTSDNAIKITKKDLSKLNNRKAKALRIFKRVALFGKGVATTLLTVVTILAAIIVMVPLILGGFIRIIFCLGLDASNTIDDLESVAGVVCDAIKYLSKETWGNFKKSLKTQVCHEETSRSETI